MVKYINCRKCDTVVSAKNLIRHQKSRACNSNKCNDSKPLLNREKQCDQCGTVVQTRNMARHKKSRLCQGFKEKDKQTLTINASTSGLKRRSEGSNEVSTQDKRSRNENNDSPNHCNEISVPSTSNVEEELNPKIRLVETAFRSRMMTAYIEPMKKLSKNPSTFLDRISKDVLKFIEDELLKCELKVNLVLLVEYEKPHFTDEVRKINFKTRNKVVLKTTDIHNVYSTSSQDLLREMEEFETKGSGWSLKKIERLELRINRYRPLRGSSYIDLPQHLKAKKAIINVRNTNDQKCFLWSILAGLHPVGRNNSALVQNYRKFEHEFDNALKDISFPVPLKDVPKFEKRTGISINVYSYRWEKSSTTNKKSIVIFPLLITKEEKLRHVDLLFMKENENTHYCLIKNLPRLVLSQITKHKESIFICKRCLSHFTKDHLLEKHKIDCSAHEAVRIEMPPEGEVVKFKSHHRKMRVPFSVYADFECMLSPQISSDGETLKGPNTKPYQTHTAVSFCLYVVGIEGHTPETIQDPITYFGLDAGEKFVIHIKDIAKVITKLYSKEAAIPMELTSNDREKIAVTTECHICNQKLKGKKTKNGNDDYTVRDHDHLTGRFRGLAHNSCNLQFRKPKFIPVFFHNLSGYDTHLFIKMMGPDCTIDVIPNTEERYISYTVNIKDCISIRFLDSLKFMPSSLETLSSNLTQCQFKHISKYFAASEMDHVTKKCTYPYDYMDAVEKYDMRSLPTKTDFYNHLNDSNITDEAYNHAQIVWTHFNIKTMKEYTLLYNKIDVLLLADIMENFRDVCLETYDLDPTWYFTSPGLAWDAMLKITNIQLQLLNDYDMILMITKGIRGGLAQCSNRLAKANNPYMNENYVSNMPTTYLMYLDANNLYGWAQSQPMPFADFQWSDTNIDVTDVLDDGPTGYILEVDLEYPLELHDDHSDFPLAPEHRVPPGSTQKKLMATLHNKEKYVVHYRALKQYLKLGMKIIKIHRVLSFSQKPWLQPYIEINTNKRTEATNEFERDFFKLMNNAVFGKTVENIRNRVNIRLATNSKQVERWVAKPNFKDRTIFNESLAAIHMSKTKLVFNKPIYVGMSILDISKTLIFNFHYEIIRDRYGSKASLLYTDTDSLVYLIETPDLYNDINSMIDHFDTSNYPQPNKYSIPSINKKVIGKMKDELCGRLMLEFVGLRAKMYAIQVEDQEPIKKSKGISSSVVEKEISFDAYKDVLITANSQSKVMRTIRSFGHNLYSVEQKKIALSANDDKRWICNGGIKTLPWGHYKILLSSY